MGIYAGTHPRSWLARLLGWYHGLALAVPVFWLGIVLAWFFGVRMRWVPPVGLRALRGESRGRGRGASSCRR